METKNIILDLRTKKGLSQDELAEKVYVTRQAVSRWENGVAIPDVELLFKLSELYGISINDILNDQENAYFFKLVMINVELKDYMDPMPTLQYSKCTKTINASIDNGRILSADYAEIWLNEVDLRIIALQYKMEKHMCINVYAAYKDYLPRWYTDYTYELFQQKTELKGQDPVLYGISKGKLNSLYGMTVQRPVPYTMEEDYITGEYSLKEVNQEEEYEKY